MRATSSARHPSVDDRIGPGAGQRRLVTAEPGRTHPEGYLDDLEAPRRLQGVVKAFTTLRCSMSDTNQVGPLEFSVVADAEENQAAVVLAIESDRPNIPSCTPP